MRIFLSYAKHDGKAIAERVQARLATVSGVTVWMDTSLDSGTVWSKIIEREIDACDVFVVLLTPDVNRPEDSAFGASFVLNEINHAQSQHKLIIPLMAIPKVRLPIQIAQLQHLDIIGGNFDQGMAHLSARLLKLVPPPLEADLPHSPASLPPRRSLNRWVILGGLLIAVVVIGLFLVIRRDSSPPPSPTLTPTTLGVTATPTDPVTLSPTPASTATLTPTPTDTLIPTHTPASFQTGALHLITVPNVVLFLEDPGAGIIGRSLLPVPRNSIVRVTGPFVSDGNRNYFPLQVVGLDTAGWIAQDSIGFFITPTPRPQVNNIIATTVSPGLPPISTEICGNLSCRGGENYLTCPFDCPTPIPPAEECGNLSCRGGESYLTCPSDCPTPIPPTILPAEICGNLVCRGGETTQTCPFDCPTPIPPAEECGNLVCRGGETTQTCPFDCPTPIPPG